MQASGEIWMVLTGIFFSVATLTAIGVLYALRLSKVQSRLAGVRSDPLKPTDDNGILDEKIRQLDDRVSLFLDQEKRSRLRSELLKAGFVSPSAPAVFFVSQMVLSLALPVLGYFVIEAFALDVDGLTKALVLSILGFIGFIGPQAYVNRQKEELLVVYRAVFPDFLDLLVVCLDAGLSINAAMDRVSVEFASQCKPLAYNLSIFLSEVRSGRAFPDALHNLSERLGIQEAKSLSTLIKQSLELGADISAALRSYADEMRVKRLLRAEMQANSLAVKMLLPLGLFILPVIFMVVLSPAIISIAALFSNLAGGF